MKGINNIVQHLAQEAKIQEKELAALIKEHYFVNPTYPSISLLVIKLHWSNFTNHVVLRFRIMNFV